jgi:hypothetical protein
LEVRWKLDGSYMELDGIIWNYMEIRWKLDGT